MNTFPLLGSLTIEKLASCNRLLEVVVWPTVKDFMYEQRKSDSESYSKFRPSRFIKEGGKWYFLTREATLEGPFELKLDAEERLESYIRVMTSGFMPRDSKLSLQSLDAPRR